MWALLHAPMPMGDDSMQPNESVSLSGAVAVVTGGGRGIGQAIATRLAAMDATVILTGRDEARVQQVARHCDTRIVPPFSGEKAAQVCGWRGGLRGRRAWLRARGLRPNRKTRLRFRSGLPPARGRRAVATKPAGFPDRSGEGPPMGAAGRVGWRFGPRALRRERRRK